MQSPLTQPCFDGASQAKLQSVVDADYYNNNGDALNL